MKKLKKIKNICELLQHSPTFFVSFIKGVAKKLEYLRENEILRKTILACLSGAQMGSIHEKK